jgi:DNA-binding HxlR family transcriptional regulator
MASFACKRKAKYLWNASVFPGIFSGMKKVNKIESGPEGRRSPCPVACALEIFGDRWTLLVVRDLMLGRSRFKDFAASPEGIPTNLLSDRLERLVRHGIVERYAPTAGAKHLAYKLTVKGESLRPLLMAMRDWGLEWEKGTRAALTGE